MKLLSFIPNSEIMNHFDNSWENINNFIKNLDLDGIETMIGNFHPTSFLDNANVKGLHLMYFPTWLDFWNRNEARLIEDFGDITSKDSYYHNFNRNSLISHYKSEFENVKKLGVKYMVFHVSHVRTSDIFHSKFDYSHKEVLEATIELINEVFQGEGPLLLFENIWWQGLTLDDKELTDWFFSQIDYQNKGFLLDLSHMMVTNGGVSTIEEGADKILYTLNNLEDTVKYIKAIHVNASISKDYIQADHSKKFESWKNSKSLDRYKVEVDHITSIDTHSVFNSHKLKDILEIVNPIYTIFELKFESIEDLKVKVEEQSLYLHGAT